MNALRPAIQRTVLAAMKRTKATMAGPAQGVHNLPPQSAVPPHLRQDMDKGFKANFLSDPSTYPIIVIMGLRPYLHDRHGNARLGVLQGCPNQSYQEVQ